ncbi:type VI secretion system baseplate subunit TssG [Zavarzinia compransoris]|uniref:Type VI secretion system baseplate subunit TssG n=1 Tax=Zavarzinia compransoris TaxID=1264899 RepID=A0A317EAW9_9PROT|nr:type VI secretion system baseplate subunit TssG [Zavarzinia compransoris]PWR22325.1 type VI secretion system baseplate subunit TssG [Zavarzinia compransoris]TDP46909.1 type VI secretion system protein ImpH [Zavarzinia compransoris]
MATARGTETAALIAALKASPEEFSLVQAVRVLERAARRAKAEDPRLADPTPIGQDGDPRLEPVRFKGAVGVAFPSGDLAAYADGLPPRLSVEAMTLDGVAGALPPAYAEIAIQTERGRQHGYHAFLDMFLHRFVSHFVQASRKYRLPLAFEAAADDQFSAALAGLIGLGTPYLDDRLAVPDDVLLHHAGLLSRRQMPLVALAAMLGNVFGTEIEIIPFIRNIIPIPPAEQSRLPDTAFPDGRFCRLGVDAVAGARVVDVQGRFRIRIGPLDYAGFRSWLPDQPKVKALADLTRIAVGPDFGFELQLSLRRDQVPAPRLGGDGTTQSHLGWNLWMSDRPFDHDPDDAIFDLDAV